jgi:hypothetical protein
MIQLRFGFPAIAALVLLLFVNSMASAQATRTWVSGVGDDANPCSRTAPCKTFAGAISKTAAGGEINCIDPGGFGAVTITKSITIDGGGTFASILNPGTNGIVVNAGVNDVVVIRNVSIQGAGTGLNGIRFLAGAELHVENCAIANQAQKGIDFQPSGVSRLFVRDSFIRNCTNATNGGAVFSKPGAAGNAQVFMDGVRMDRCLFGLQAQDRAASTSALLSTVTVRNCTTENNLAQGFLAFSTAGGPVVINLESCIVAGNGAASIRSVNAGATIRLSNVMVVNNATGLSPFGGGAIVSFGNNRIAGNGPNGDGSANGAPTATPGQQ